MNRLSFYLLSLFLSLPLLHAFPDNLYGPVGCATELATDEVIMNSLITAYADSRDSAVKVVVLAPDGMTELESPIIVSKVPMTVTMVVRNPNAVGGMQYVMDVSNTAKAIEGEADNLNGVAHFERGQCDGQKRVTGRPGDRHTLIIDKIPETPIQVWAGWACSHEAVTLTNYFTFSKQPTDRDDGGAAKAVEEAVNQVLDLEQADQNEREDLQAELGDDDVANVGDLEEQLDLMHANKDVRQDLEQMFKNRAHWEEKDPNNRLPHQNLEKYKDLIQEKKLNNRDAVKGVDWDQVKKRLALEGHLDVLKETKMAEHKRLMLERRERMMNDKRNGHNDPRVYDRKLEDQARRSGMFKERFEERRAMMAQKLKAPLPNDVEEGEQVDETNSNPVQRRAREAYEEQDSDIVVKEILMGLLGILLANWIIVQLCLWNDKRNKGRRVL